MPKIITKLEELRPHERDVLHNELLKELEIQEKVSYIIENEFRERELLAMNCVAQSLKEQGYTSEDINNSDNDPDLKKVIWATLGKYWHLYSSIPLNRLLYLFGITIGEFNQIKNQTKA